MRTETCEDWDEDIVLTEEERRLSAELDKDILRERVMAGVEMTTYLHNRVDKERYGKAKRRQYHETAKRRNPEAVTRYGRESYARHKEKRLAHNRAYYDANREEILAQKQGYYRTYKDEILAQHKDNYVPHPVEVIDSKLAEYRRQKSKRSYQNRKDEISARRKAKRQAIKELWNNVTKQTFVMNDKTKQELYVVKQKSINFPATGIGYQISQVIDPMSTPTSVNKNGATFPFKYVYEEINLEFDSVVCAHFISMNTIRKNYGWFLLEDDNEMKE